MRLVIQTADIAEKFVDAATSQRANRLAKILGGTVDETKIVADPRTNANGSKELGGAQMSQISVPAFDNDYDALMANFKSQGFFIADVREYPQDDVIKFQLTTNERASIFSPLLDQGAYDKVTVSAKIDLSAATPAPQAPQNRATAADFNNWATTSISYGTPAPASPQLQSAQSMPSPKRG